MHVETVQHDLVWQHAWSIIYSFISVATFHSALSCGFCIHVLYYRLSHCSFCMRMEKQWAFFVFIPRHNGTDGVDVVAYEYLFWVLANDFSWA